MRFEPASVNEAPHLPGNSRSIGRLHPPWAAAAAGVSTAQDPSGWLTYVDFAWGRVKMNQGLSFISSEHRPLRQWVKSGRRRWEREESLREPRSAIAVGGLGLRQVACFGAVLASAAGPWNAAWADSLVMRDGRVLEGSLVTVAGLAENPLKTKAGDAPSLKTILMVDNNLTRTFVSKNQSLKMQEGNEKQPLSPVKIQIPQHVAVTGFHIARLGPIVRMQKWDEWGRRTVTIMSDKGPLDVIQGITEITPLWTKVQGLAVKPAYIWDMRIATSSIPRDTLSMVISKQIDPKNLNDRLKLVKLFLQSERYQDAQHELQAIVEAFPGQEELQKEIRAIQQLASRRIIEEVNVRRKAGQHRFAYEMLQQFPRKDVAGETLQQVRQMLDGYADTQKQGTEILTGLENNVKAIKDAHNRDRAKQSSRRSLPSSTSTRSIAWPTISAADAEDLSDEQKLSLAVSGWLLGSNHASTNLAVSLSLVEVRNLIREYLREPTKLRRNAILTSMRWQEGSTPEMVARIIAHMKPPTDSPGPEENQPGFFQLEVPSLDKEPNVTYYVQLPPEYDPYRRYPTVITLNGAGTTPLQQIDWWAGGWTKTAIGSVKPRGTATSWWPSTGPSRIRRSTNFRPANMRPCWSASATPLGGFPSTPTACICRGHSMGGDAAWDLAIAHPDLWAGVIPIVAVADKYSAFYTENAGLVPFYFVAGELDGDKLGAQCPRPGPLSEQALRRHDGRIPGARARAFPRRDPAHFRLDGPSRPQFLSQEIRRHDDAHLGQLFLVAGAGAVSGDQHRRTDRLAARPQFPAGSNRSHDQGQFDQRQDRGRESHRLALPRAGRL